MPHNTQCASATRLNLILGDSAGGTFRATFGRNEDLLVDPDVLSCGPTPRRSDLGVWRTLRLKFWTDLVPGVFEDCETWPSGLLENVQRLGSADRIIIWAATGLNEQLFIASVCNLISTENVPLDRVELVQFEYLPNRRARVIGMGELKETHMRNHPAAVPLAHAVFENYLASWDALTSSDPRSIECFAENSASASEWLKNAMRLMLRRFPDVTSGLGHWDIRLLAHVHKHGPSAVRVIAHALTENWNDADLVGDHYLFGRLLRIGAENLPMPLLRIAGDPSNMRTTEVDLTPFGLDVLEGRASNYPTNPVEEWAAGVQLSSSRGTLWFRDGDRLVAPAAPCAGGTD
jgi:hypothetical protein